MTDEVIESPWKNFSPDEELPVKKIMKTKLRFSDESSLSEFNEQLSDVLPEKRISEVYDLAVNQSIPDGYVRQEFEGGEDDFIELKFEELMAIYFPRPNIEEFKKKFSFLN